MSDRDDVAAWVYLYAPEPLRTKLKAVLVDLQQAEWEREAEKTRGIDHALYEMVCEERDALESRLEQAEQERDEAARVLGELTEETLHVVTGKHQAEAKADSLAETLREITTGEWDDVDPDDGLHQNSVRAFARAALGGLNASRASPNAPLPERTSESAPSGS